ncbi:MAG: thioredoxin family protein [Chlamydiia bacterium]|nr:thioredoxin family protein [Chlamydiia bacterium]
MNRSATILLVLSLMYNLPVGAAETKRSPNISNSPNEAIQPHGPSWTTDYQQALDEAKRSNRSLVLFFTGSDWCTWCKKLEQEVLDTREFVNATKNRYVFVMLDFPRRSKQNKALVDQNRALRDRYSVRGFPTLLVLDSQERVLGELGYQKGGATPFLARLDSLNVQKVVSNPSPTREKEEEALKIPSQEAISEKTSKVVQATPVFKADQERKLENLRHLRARYFERLENRDDTGAMEVLDDALAVERDPFFLTEKYRLIGLMGGNLQSADARQLRSEILSAPGRSDQVNSSNLAVIEFEHLRNQMKSNDLNPQTVVAPLEAYVEEFGDSDRANRWRMEGSIARIYYQAGDYENALKHLQLSLETAPEMKKTEVRAMIEKVSSDAQQKMTTEGSN